MAETTDRVIVELDGSIRVVSRSVNRRLRERAGSYQLVTDADGVLILRAEPNERRSGPRVLMAGEIVSRTSVLEVMNVVATVGWRGEMHVIGPNARRILGIDGAAIKYAASDHPDDRLGQVLYRNGVLTKVQLDDILADVDPERRFGQVVLERGYLSQDVLYAQLQKQIEQIFFGSLLVREGSYLYIQPDDQAEPPNHSVHLPVNALLMEGVQRLDEMALFREKIPHDDLVPVIQPRATKTSLDSNAHTVMAYADGERTIETIARETGLGQFLTVKALYGLIQRNLVILRPKKVADAAAIKRLITEFNDVLRDIFMAVATYGGLNQTRATLETWIVGSGYGPILGETVDEDGSIESDHVVQALAEVKVDNPLEGLHQALHELSAFALFAATTSLPREQELSLSRDVNARLKKIRL